VTLEAGKDYWWCASAEQEPAVCDGSHKTTRSTDEYTTEKAGDYWLCAASTQQKAALRRYATNLGISTRKFALLAPVALALSLGACGWFGAAANDDSTTSIVRRRSPSRTPSVSPVSRMGRAAIRAISSLRRR